MVYNSEKVRRQWVSVDKLHNNRLCITNLTNGESIEDASIFELVKASKFSYRMKMLQNGNNDDMFTTDTGSNSLCSNIASCFTCCINKNNGKNNSNATASGESDEEEENDIGRWIGVDFYSGITSIDDAQQQQRNSDNIHLKPLSRKSDRNGGNNNYYDVSFDSSIIIELEKFSPKIDLDTVLTYSIRCYKDGNKYIGYLSAKYFDDAKNNNYNMHNDVRVAAAGMANPSFNNPIDSQFKFEKFHQMEDIKQFGENAFKIKDVYPSFGKRSPPKYLALRNKLNLQNDNDGDNDEKKEQLDNRNIRGLSAFNNGNATSGGQFVQFLEEGEFEKDNNVWNLLQLDSEKFLIQHFCTKEWLAYGITEDDSYYLRTVKLRNNTHPNMLSLLIQPNNDSNLSMGTNIPSPRGSSGGFGGLGSLKQSDYLDKPEVAVIKKYTNKLLFYVRKAYESRIYNIKYVKISCGLLSHEFLIESSSNNEYLFTNIPSTYDTVQVQVCLLDDKHRRISGYNEIETKLLVPKSLVVFETNLLKFQKNYDYHGTKQSGYYIDQKNKSLCFFGDNNRSESWVNLKKPCLLGKHPFCLN